ncbi:MAG TPA: helix-turn-helix domain-containing protein [Candidatus Tumulicola sp.]|nr:helix-turn-helix domain-containing protein [Candidatus Tumulicola sp.]
MNSAVLEAYGALLNERRPRVIRSEKENEAALAEVRALLAARARTPAIEEYLDLLAALIEKYEEEHYQMPQAATPADILRELMLERGMTVTELGALIKSKGTASQMLSGRRKISVKAAKRFAEFFKVPVSLFL